jgi:hypothetical protein
VTAALALGIAGGAGSAQAATLPTLTLTVGASSISVAGATQAGAVNVVATASGAGKEPAVILFALRPEATAAELFKAIETGKDPNVATKFGSIVFDNEALPGKGSEAQTLLTAGKYVALVTEGEGKPKAHTEFTVTTSTSPVALPTPEATEKTIEFGFRGPSTLHDGELVQWENEGFLVHMDFALPVKSKAAAKRLVKDLLTGNERAAGKLIAGQPFGAGPLSTGGFQQTTVTAKPGWYVQACFMDTQDGRQHTQLGMERIIKITK